MSIILRWIKRKPWWSIPLGLLLGIGYVFNQGIPWDDNCWSPNHEYYIVRKESVMSALWSGFGFEYGWVLIYDKHHNLLHRRDIDLNIQGGPFWRGDLLRMWGQEPFRLPTNGGEGDFQRICY